MDTCLQTSDSIANGLFRGYTVGLTGTVGGLTGNVPSFGVVPTAGQTYPPYNGATYPVEGFQYAPAEKVEHKPKVTIKALKEHIGRKFR